MTPLDNRKLVLRCCEAFQKFVDPTLVRLSDSFVAGMETSLSRCKELKLALEYLIRGCMISIVLSCFSVCHLHACLDSKSINFLMLRRTVLCIPLFINVQAYPIYGTTRAYTPLYQVLSFRTTSGSIIIVQTGNRTKHLSNTPPKLHSANTLLSKTIYFKSRFNKQCKIYLHFSYDTSFQLDRLCNIINKNLESSNFLLRQSRIFLKRNCLC